MFDVIKNPIAQKTNDLCGGTRCAIISLSCSPRGLTTANDFLECSRAPNRN